MKPWFQIILSPVPMIVGAYVLRNLNLVPRGQVGRAVLGTCGLLYILLGLAGLGLGIVGAA